MKKVLIAIATYNEAKNITKLIKKIENIKLKNYKILFLDDNSPDKTAKIIFNLKRKNIKILIRPKKSGLDTAHKLFFNYAITGKYNYLITLDADLSHNPKDIISILKYLDNYDFVIGSRYIAGGNCQMSLSRYLLSYIGNKFIKFLLGTKINEHTTSFRGFNLQKLIKKKFNLTNVKSKGYSFFMETIFLLKFKKCSIKEIPINFVDRKFGYSKIPRVELFRTLFNVIRLWFKK